MRCIIIIIVFNLRQHLLRLYMYFRNIIRKQQFWKSERMLTEFNIDVWINCIPFLHSSNTINQEHPKRALSGIRIMPNLFFNSNYSYPSKHDFISISIVMTDKLVCFQLNYLPFSCISFSCLPAYLDARLNSWRSINFEISMRSIAPDVCL